MKFKISFIITLLVMVNCFITKANNINRNHNFSSYAKITAIDAALNKAKSFEDLKIVLSEMHDIDKNIFRKTYGYRENDTIPPFTEISFSIWNKLWCGDIVTKAKVSGAEMERFEYLYEKRLWQMAGVIIGVDDEITIKYKIQTWWNKYKTRCKADSTTFNVPNGSILKFALSQSQPEFILYLLDYDLDINFLDPADGQNLLEYLNNEIKNLYNNGSSNTTIIRYEKYKATFIKLGAKTSK